MAEFQLNETVIVENHGEFYTAKIIIVNEDRVKLHFNGWSPKYDTWMDMDELIKLNDMNLSLMKLDKEEHKASSSKNYTQCDLINEINASFEQTNSLDFPFLLKQRIIQDWYMVNDRKVHVPIPRNPSASTILKIFEEEYTDKSSQTNNFVLAMLYMLNTCIEKGILYPSELSLYQLIKKKTHLVNSDVYGAEHLLRMMYIIPNLYDMSEMTEKEVSMVRDVFVQFLKFLMVHPEFFCSIEDYCAYNDCKNHIKLL